MKHLFVSWNARIVCTSVEHQKYTRLSWIEVTFHAWLKDNFIKTFVSRIWNSSVALRRQLSFNKSVGLFSTRMGNQTHYATPVLQMKCTGGLCKNKSIRQTEHKSRSVMDGSCGCLVKKMTLKNLHIWASFFDMSKERFRDKCPFCSGPLTHQRSSSFFSLEAN